MTTKDARLPSPSMSGVPSAKFHPRWTETYVALSLNHQLDSIASMLISADVSDSVFRWVTAVLLISRRVYCAACSYEGMKGVLITIIPFYNTSKAPLAGTKY